jgi:hypothetical protein
LPRNNGQDQNGGDPKHSPDPINYISLLTTNRKPIIITTKPIYLVWINLFGRLGFTDLPGSLKNPAKYEEYTVCLR